MRGADVESAGGMAGIPAESAGRNTVRKNERRGKRVEDRRLRAGG